ncbi:MULTISPECIES: M20/M25/M40 family metallo-hydrolase [Gammaproteobacteria]|uniref:M20/M25/M40 family metallo-hydrolase n=1 Tax=Gammaproteobacteria TaxID=1236 RepID=UPI001403D394|nr:MULTISPECIES: M20/M25/M40 family metallo-hydrolase [Gammaproteobacteria]
MRRNLKFIIALIIGLSVAALLGKFAWSKYVDHLTAKEQLRVESLIAAAEPAKRPNRINAETLIADIRWLSHDDRQGRAPDTEGGIAARNFIIERFNALQLTPAGTENFEHAFTVPDNKTAVNVLARIEGQQPSLRTIVITAHYDHVGVHEGRIYNGADDNASGTATLLAIAEYLSEHQPQHNVLLAALDAEENGLRGAKALFETGLLTPDAIAFNLNLDMLSRDTDNLLFAVGSYHTPWLVPLIDRAQAESAVKLIAAYDRPRSEAGDTPDWTTASDHAPFHLRGIPFIYLGVPDHPDYHQPTDTFENVDIDFFHASAETALSVFKVVDLVLAEKE